MSPKLKSKLIRLGSTNPELRPHIRPILSELEFQQRSAWGSAKAISPRDVDINRGGDIEVHGTVVGYFEGDRATIIVDDREVDLYGNERSIRKHLVEDYKFDSTTFELV